MKTILIVDDEQDVLRVLSSRLKKEGYRTVEASNGKEAVDKAKSGLPDLILLDIVMPDMDGAEVARILREDATTKDIPVIFLTCLFTKRDEVKEGYLVGNNIFVAKPYDSNELLSIISDTIK